MINYSVPYSIKLIDNGFYISFGKYLLRNPELASVFRSVPNDRFKVDPRKYEITYYPITEAFTTNLADGSGFLQIGISLSTFYDGKVINNIKRQAVPIRSVVLMVLSEQDPALLSTSQGKQRLQRQLTAAINDVLREKEGFGGVEGVIKGKGELYDFLKANQKMAFVNDLAGKRNTIKKQLNDLSMQRNTYVTNQKKKYKTVNLDDLISRSVIKQAQHKGFTFTNSIN